MTAVMYGIMIGCVILEWSAWWAITLSSSQIWVKPAKDGSVVGRCLDN